jgi:hypothetical protein
MRLAEPPEYMTFLAPYPEATQALARAVRLRVLEMLPDCFETLWDATNAVAVGYGFTEKSADHFLHLPVYTSYVNLGFAYGATLDDPEGRLKGAGSRVRHVRLDSATDLDDPYVQGLIAEAVANAPYRTAQVTPRTIVRVMDGPKRRPRAQ